MKNILISGATGFIGQRLVRAINANIKVLAREKQPDYETVICNLESQVIPNNSLNEIDTVFHLAAFAHDIGNATKSKNIYQKINVDATISLAKLAVKSDVKSFIFVSSVKAGGRPTFSFCASEKDQGDPEDIYGKTKREAELQLLKISKESGMHVSIIRPSLVYGPFVKGNLKSMMLGIKKGWFPPLPKTGNKKSMIHVDDLVRAMLLLVDDNRANREIFIATDGIRYSSHDIYNVMCSLLGKPSSKWRVPKFVFDIVSLVNPRIKYKVTKLLGDECYSSAKLEALGFKAQKTLKDMNETSF